MCLCTKKKRVIKQLLFLNLSFKIIAWKSVGILLIICYTNNCVIIDVIRKQANNKIKKHNRQSFMWIYSGYKIFKTEENIKNMTKRRKRHKTRFHICKSDDISCISYSLYQIKGPFDTVSVTRIHLCATHMTHDMSTKTMSSCYTQEMYFATAYRFSLRGKNLCVRQTMPLVVI